MQSDLMSLTIKNRKTTRCFALGIGDSVSRSFIEEFTKTSGGSSLFTNDSKQFSPLLMSQFSSASIPAITDAKILEKHEDVEIAPSPVPPLFASKITCIFAKNVNEDIIVEGNEYE